MKFHPLADAFPLIDGDEFHQLVKDVREHGLLEHIVVHDGQILDGRNRWRACAEAGVEPVTREWSGECDHPALFVISQNIHRRHLSASQRGLIVKRHLLPVLEEEAAKRRGHGETAPGKPKTLTPETAGASGEATEQAARAAGVGKTTVKEAKAVDDADPALGDEVLAGKKSLGEAKREIRERDLGVNRVPMPMQRVVKEILRDVRQEENARRIVATATKLPTGELEALAERWDSGGDYDRSYVTTRLAQVKPPADPRANILSAVVRELKRAEGMFDDEWKPSLGQLAGRADEIRRGINQWRKDNA